MKKFNKKIIMSVLTLILTVIALGTTTFAWFSLSTVSKVSNISGTVTAGDGLEVRMVLVSYDDQDNEWKADDSKKTDWKANLSADEVEVFINSIFNNKKFEAVTASTMGTFTKMKQNESGQLVINDSATANTDFLQFGIEFRSQATGSVKLMELDLGGEPGIEFNVDGSSYVQIPSNEGDPEGNPVIEASKTSEPVLTYAKYAARVSFDSIVFQYGVDAETIKIENNKVQGNTFMLTKGIYAGQYSYLIDSKGLKLHSADNVEITDPTSITILEAHKNTEAATQNVTVSLDSTSETGMDAYKGLFVVRIWIEGWDADAYDSIYNTQLVVSMKFEKFIP